MTLADVFPPRLVADKFIKPVQVHERSLSDIDELARTEPNTVIQIGLSVWHQIVTRSLFDVEPSAMASHIMSEDPFLYRRIEERLAIEAISDLYYLEMHIDDPVVAAAPACATLCLVKTYPNDLFLADVAFVNPYKPIPAHRRCYEYQEFEGLGLLPELVRRLVEHARRHQIERLLLVAAASDLVPLFETHGFSVDDSEMARICLNAGRSIPMQMVFIET